MADDATTESNGALPPKLDLRKSGILKSVPPAGTPVTPSVPTESEAPPMAPAAVLNPIFTPVAPVAAVTPVAAQRPATVVPASGPVGMLPTRPSGAPVPGTGAQPAWKPKPAGITGAKPVGLPVPGNPARSGPAGAMRPVSVPATSVSATTAEVAEQPATAVTPPKSASKKETSRIPLDAAKPRVEKSFSSVGLEPPTTVRISKPGETAQITGLPKPDDVAAAEKRKTSRISLEAVLNETPADSASGGTKTIRLKRPGEAPTAKVGGAKSAGEQGAGGETASPTQRKTVLVKRPQESASSRKLTVARTGEEGGASSASGGASDNLSMPVRGPHWIFGVLSIAAALVMCVVIYLFAAQAIGPNSSMTQYSSLPTGPNLAWPGKIAFR